MKSSIGDDDYILSGNDDWFDDDDDNNSKNAFSQMNNNNNNDDDDERRNHQFGSNRSYVKSNYNNDKNSHNSNSSKSNIYTDYKISRSEVYSSNNNNNDNNRSSNSRYNSSSYGNANTNNNNNNTNNAYIRYKNANSSYNHNNNRNSIDNAGDNLNFRNSRSNYQNNSDNWGSLRGNYVSKQQRFSNDANNNNYDQNKENHSNFYQKRKFDDSNAKQSGNMYEKTFTDSHQSNRQFNTYVPNLEDSNFSVFNEGNAIGVNFSEYHKIPINVNGPNAPQGINRFEDANLNSIIQNNIKSCSFPQPTPCQSYSIPTILAKKDLICCAHTGSGKTAAFLLPILHLIMAEKKNELDSNNNNNDNDYNSRIRHPHQVYPKALILSPTRELTIQTYHNFKKFASDTNVSAKLCYGGTTNSFQINHLKNGCDVLIATIGRLLDLINRRVIFLDDIKFVVLDEADRLLDMGFYNELDTLLAKCSILAQRAQESSTDVDKKGNKQLLMYSATFPEELQKLGAIYLKKDYIFIAIGIVGSVNPNIEQKCLQCSSSLSSSFSPNQSKLTLLQEELEKLRNLKILIFVKSKKTADFLAAKLSMCDFKASSIHGDRLQSQRELVLCEFFSGKRNILVATDVAARGLDIPRVDYVINYDLPNDIEIYIHRVGRTGRVGNSGKSLSFVDLQSDDPEMIRNLIGTLRDSNQEIPDWLIDISGSSFNRISRTSNIEHDIRHNSNNTKNIIENDNATAVDMIDNDLNLFDSYNSNKNVNNSNYNETNNCDIDEPIITDKNHDLRIGNNNLQLGNDDSNANYEKFNNNNKQEICIADNDDENWF